MNTLKPLLLTGSALMLSACLGGSSGSSGDSGASARETGSASIDAPDCKAADCVAVGGFSKPFVEPWGPSAMKAMAADPLLTPKGNAKNPLRQVPQDDRCLRMADGRPTECKPAAGSMALLEDDRVLYFNALEGTEDAEFSIFFEAGTVVSNDQTRVLSLRGGQAGWLQPSPVDGGANPQGYAAALLLPKGTIDTSEANGSGNDGALFCSDIEMLADGRILAVGGTDYYLEPGIQKPVAFGVSELEGIRNARLFNPRDNSWRKTGDMTYGRWYPSLTTLASGDVLVSSGVTKLVKPVYPDRPETSGRNVTQTETYDLACGSFSENGGPGERSLPLYPRQHLLPNGQVYYNGAGQAFNPFGQSYDQALWNIVAAYDPATRQWTDLGYAGLPLRMNEAGLDRIASALNPTNDQASADIQKTLTGLAGALSSNPAGLLQDFADGFSGDPQAAIMKAIGAGFRGSTFSIQMPLRANAQGRYDKAEFLTAGGVFGAITATSPGSYVATNLSRIDSVNIGSDNSMRYESRVTGSLAQPRWYGTGVLLPTGQVMVFSGANRDEVALPGTGTPILQTEIFDPKTETWTPMATQHNPRTYHNTAMLLPDGRVLVGGHAPINTAYAYSINLPGMSPNDGRDPSFEIYSPPYVFGARPVINAAPASAKPGDSLTITTAQAADVVDVVLVKRTTLTHLIDGDQRSVVLPVTARDGGSLTVKMPDAQAVVPAGGYMLFIVTKQGDKLVPSVSAPVHVNGPARSTAQCGAAARTAGR